MNRLWLLGIVGVALVVGVVAMLLPAARDAKGVSVFSPSGGSAIANPPIDDHAQTTLRVLMRWKGEHYREKYIAEIAREFGFLNPDINFKAEFHQDVGLANEKMIAGKIVEMIKSGNIEWDVVPVNTGQYRDVALALGDPHWGHKYLVDFSKFDWFEDVHKPCVVENRTYCEPFDGMAVGPFVEGFYCTLWYNADVAKRLGVTVPSHGMTVDQFTAIVKAIYDYNQTHTTKVVPIHEAKDWRTTEYLFRYLFASAIGDLEKVREEASSPQKLAALLKTFKALEKLSNYKPIGNDYNNHGWSDTRDYALKGKTFFSINGSWMYSHWMGIDEKLTMKMTPAELPTFQPADFYIGFYTSQYAVLKDSPNRKQAIEFLEFCSQPKFSERWVQYTKAPTGLRGNLSQSDSGDDQFEQFQNVMTTKYGGNLHFTEDVGFIFGKENELLTGDVNELVVKILAGETTAQEAYDAIIAKCK